MSNVDDLELYGKIKILNIECPPICTNIFPRSMYEVHSEFLFRSDILYTKA